MCVPPPADLDVRAFRVQIRAYIKAYPGRVGFAAIFNGSSTGPTLPTVVGYQMWYNNTITSNAWMGSAGQVCAADIGVGRRGRVLAWAWRRGAWGVTLA